MFVNLSTYIRKILVVIQVASENKIKIPLKILESERNKFYKIKNPRKAEQLSPYAVWTSVSWNLCPSMTIQIHFERKLIKIVVINQKNVYILGSTLEADIPTFQTL
jgi:hypothetical protein